MALLMCKSCKRAFISGLPNEAVCPECMIKLKELYMKVHNFLRDHEKQAYTIYEVGNILNINKKDLEGLVASGLIDPSCYRGRAPIQQSAPPRGYGDMHIYNKKKAREDVR